MKLSVVIIARNEEKSIARCIESVLKHTTNVCPVEVLLADSASTDRTVEIASSYPINIISLKPEWPLSPAAGRFSGVNNVQGKYVLIIDGDMILLEGWIEKALIFLDNHPNVGAVVGRLTDIRPNIYDEIRALNPNSIDFNEIKKTDVAYGSAIFNREILLKSGNFQPFLRAEEEAEISYRMISGGYDIFCLPYDAVDHYTILRNTFAETIRRFRKNLWAGMGDMFSWCLNKGYYGIVWKQFHVFFLFSGLILFVLLGLLLTFITKDKRWAIEGMSLFGLFVGIICIKKRNIYLGLLSVVNIAIITWCLWNGLTRKIPESDEYPRDVVWVK